LIICPLPLLTRFSEFAKKREDAVETNQRLQTEAQVVLDVIGREEVAQALRQDKVQNLNYLRENYNVRKFT
jgi:translation initiation factor 3 subunit E